jgi:hypothetical protein
MDLITPDSFLAHTRALGVAPDDRYSSPQCLVYVPHRQHARFWNFPKRAAGFPFFISHMLDTLAPWSECHLWPRGGQWPALPDDADCDLPLAWTVRGRLLGAAGIPACHQGAACYTADERDQLVTAVFAQLVFGWCPPDDLFILPDHGRYFLHTDHHGVIHANFRDEADITPFVEHMAQENYLLPTQLPDATFKLPSWMT